MNTLNTHDINIIEGEDSDELEYFSAIQRAINSGSAWSFQGSYGRSMMDAIKAGYCMLGEHPASDYYGNRIPSRSEVKAGTAGSAAFVLIQRGEDWHDAMLMA